MFYTFDIDSELKAVILSWIKCNRWVFFLCETFEVKDVAKSIARCKYCCASICNELEAFGIKTTNLFVENTIYDHIMWLMCYRCDLFVV